MNRALLLLIVLGAALPWGVALAMWPDLPARIPTHFDAGGLPDAWGDRGEWWLLPIVATLISVVAGGIALLVRWIARAHPELINVPSKEAFLRLDEGARLAVLQPVVRFSVVLVFATQGLMSYLQIGTVRVAKGLSSTLPSLPIFLFAGVVLVAVIFLVLALRRRIAEEVARQG